MVEPEIKSRLWQGLDPPYQNIQKNPRLASDHVSRKRTMRTGASSQWRAWKANSFLSPALAR
jgi:hypothetical protein